MMYLRFILTGLVFLPAYLLGLVIHPFMYLLRKKGGGIFWLWANKSEPTFIDNWYGIYEIYNNDYKKFETLNAWQKYKISYEWLAIRNSHFNLKEVLFPFGKLVFNKKVVKNSVDTATWRNSKNLGLQWIVMIDENNNKSFRLKSFDKISPVFLSYRFPFVKKIDFFIHNEFFI